MARGGLATKTPKLLIYIGVNHKIATNRCSTCLEHLKPYFDANFSKMLVPQNWYRLAHQCWSHFHEILTEFPPTKRWSPMQKILILVFQMRFQQKESNSRSAVDKVLPANQNSYGLPRLVDRNYSKICRKWGCYSPMFHCGNY